MYLLNFNYMNILPVINIFNYVNIVRSVGWQLCRRLKAGLSRYRDTQYVLEWDGFPNSRTGRTEEKGYGPTVDQ